jgi:1-acyl-sn-glycerol-3-phosphate acyltransferase
MEWLFRRLILFAIRVFYREIGTQGAERLPNDGPIMIVSNHPNGLMDPVVVRVAVGRRLAFLGKSTFFSNPFGRLMARSFDMIPVYRSVDGSDTSKNEKTFELCRQRLKNGEWLMLFPEGTSHSDPAMKRLKTGAARIALSAEAENGFKLGLRILPVGMLYEDKEIFRSRVGVAVGSPIRLAGYAEQFATDDHAAVSALTATIEEALSAVVLQADSEELWRGFLAVAAWTDAESLKKVAVREERARALARAFHDLSQRDPEASERVIASARRFAEVLRSVGIEDPFAIDAPVIPPPAVLIRRVLLPIVLALPALIGIVLTFVPYQVIAQLVARWRRLEPDLTATVKALGGIVFFPLTYLIEAVLVGLAWGPVAGVVTFGLAPLFGLAALHWLEMLDRRRAALRTLFLRLNRGRLTDAITRRRQELCELVERALAGAA